jgi:hypothetical protein
MSGRSARITEEASAELRAHWGADSSASGYLETAARDAIRHFAPGIGDTNPLWRDEAYAAGT